MAGVRIFRYIEALDSFVVTEEYRSLASQLGLTEWHPTVWIGRLFTLDNDYGEHWLDNWDEREALTGRAAEFGIDPNDLMIIAPERLANGVDGPCHPPELRKRFWTDVLKSLELSYELLFEAARLMNADIKDVVPDEYIGDLEERISHIQSTSHRPAVNRETIEELLQRRPFEPFEVRVSNGDVHQVRNPEFAVLLKSNLVIGYPDSDRIAICSLSQIANVQKLRAA